MIIGCIHAYNEKPKVKAVCKDIHKYMDGTYSATIISGGVFPKTSLTLYQLSGSKKKRIGTVYVTRSKYKKKITYTAKDLKLTVKRRGKKKAGTLEMLLDGSKIKAKMGCKTMS